MRYVWIVMALQVVSTPIAIFVPLVVRRVVDDTLAPQDTSTLAFWAGLLVVLALVGAVVGVVAGTLLIRFRVKVLHDLQLSLFRHMLGFSTSYRADHDTGFLMSRQIDDVRNLGGVMADALVRVLIQGFRGVAYLGMILYLEWHMATGGFILVALMFGIAYAASPHLRQLATVALERWTAVSASIHQSLTGHLLIQATATETRESIRFAKILHSSIRAGVRRDIVSLYLQQAYAVITATGPVLIVLMGLWLIVTTDFTIGGLFAFFMYLGQLLAAVGAVFSFNAALQGSVASLERIFQILDTRSEVESPPGGGKRIEVAGALHFEGVSYAYEEDRLVLRDIELEIPPYTRVALVGRSGAGKSTLAALVPRFFDPVAGRVRVDGIDLRELDLRWYRKQVGFVPQDVFLFGRTISENIAIGRARATADEVRAAATAANALEFIDEMPDGFDTAIGERGVKLSGGQRQRLAIARELLRDPRILILDEATSALDSESEALVQEALERLLQGRTSIVIAHRLSTIVGSDLILVIDDGYIVERGRHSELLALGERYAALYHRQFETPFEPA